MSQALAMSLSQPMMASSNVKAWPATPRGWGRDKTNLEVLFPNYQQQ